MGETLRNILEIGFGILFTIGAVFNSLYTFKNGEEFYGSFVERALLPPAHQLVEAVVIPRNQFFTVVMIVIQLTSAISIYSRGGLVKPGLIFGSDFCLWGGVGVGCKWTDRQLTDGIPAFLSGGIHLDWILPIWSMQMRINRKMLRSTK